MLGWLGMLGWLTKIIALIIIQKIASNNIFKITDNFSSDHMLYRIRIVLNRF